MAEDLAFNGNGELADKWFREGLEYRRGKAKPKEREKDPTFYDAASQIDVWFRVHGMDNRIIDPGEDRTVSDVIRALRDGLIRRALLFGVHKAEDFSHVIIAGEIPLTFRRTGLPPIKKHILVFSVREGVGLDDLETADAMNSLRHLAQIDRLTESSDGRVHDASGYAEGNPRVGVFPT